MHTFVTNLENLLKVSAIGLVLGAGLPLIFALGIRFWSIESDAVSADGVASRSHNTVARAGAAICFGIVVVAVLLGVVYVAKAFLAHHFGIHLFGA